MLAVVVDGEGDVDQQVRQRQTQAPLAHPRGRAAAYVVVAAAEEDPSKALVEDRYSSAGAVLRIEDLEIPPFDDDEVLVRVRAASAKPWVWDLPAIVTLIGRMAARFLRPRTIVPGLDFAGEVESVGKGVTRFRPGAEVFGWAKGALAEFVSVSEDSLALKPSTVSFAEAASIAVSGSTALRALRKGQVRSGDQVLVVGASGGVGIFAVQLAKVLGAEVAGVCRTTNMDLVRSLGANQVIDYTEQDFTRDESRYDVILDMADNRSLSDLRRALRPGGTLVMVGQSGIPTSEQTWLKALSRWFRAAVWSLFIDQRSAQGPRGRERPPGADAKDGEAGVSSVSLVLGWPSSAGANRDSGSAATVGDGLGVDAVSGGDGGEGEPAGVEVGRGSEGLAGPFTLGVVALDVMAVGVCGDGGSMEPALVGEFVDRRP